MYRLVLIVVILLPAQALAQTNHVFIWSNELGEMVADDTDTAMPFQEYSATNADATFTTTYGDNSNDFAIRYNTPSGSAVYQSRTTGLSAETVTCALAFLRVASSPSSRRKIISFEDGSGNDTAFLTIKANTPGFFRINSWYEDMGNECKTSTNNGTECSTNADCDSVNPGEAECSGESWYGQSAQLTEGTTYVVGLEQDNTAGSGGDVKVSLYVGEPGAVYAYSQRTKPQGACSGGTNTYACSTNADCSGADTCTVTDILTTGKVNFGTDDTVAAAADYSLDNLVILDTGCSGYENYRIQTLIPDGEGTPVDWSDANGCGSIHDGCLNENIGRTDVVADGDTSRLQTTNDGTVGEVTVEDVTLTDTCTASVCVKHGIACSVAADCTMSLTNAAASVVSSMNRPSASPSAAFNVATLLEEGANQTSSSTAQLDQHTDSTYRPDGYLLATLAPDGGTWTEADFDALEIVYTYNKGSCSSNCRAKISTGIVDTFFTLPTPPVPTVIPDNDSDTEDTVGLIGNSRLNGPVASGFFDGIIEANNIYNIARGGSTIGDLAENLSNIKEGSASGYLHAFARKGAEGATLDIAVLMFGVNALRSGNFAPPSLAVACASNSDCVNGTCTTSTCTGSSICQGTIFPCANNSDCGYCTKGQQGYCEDDDGADQGNTCWCPQTDWWLSDPSDVNTTRYCITGGTDWKAQCDSSDECSCASSADCQSGSTCSGGTCTLGGGAAMTCAVNSTKPLTMCMPGCLSAPGCSSGVCVAGNSLAAVIGSYKASIDTLLSNGVDVVLVGTPDTEEVTDIIKESRQTGCWGWLRPPIGVLNGWLQDYATTDTDLHWIDGQAVMRQCCPDGDIMQCLKDGVHFNATGEQCIADTINACLTNESGTSDGVCAAPTCTGGRVGDACSTNSDCDLYNCSF